MCPGMDEKPFLTQCISFLWLLEQIPTEWLKTTQIYYTTYGFEGRNVKRAGRAVFLLEDLAGNLLPCLSVLEATGFLGS